jgi:hypothetical protein
MLLLYVDDMIITDDDLSGIQEHKDFLSQHFAMKDLGNLNYFMCLAITYYVDGFYQTQAKPNTPMIFCFELASLI